MMLKYFKTLEGCNKKVDIRDQIVLEERILVELMRQCNGVMVQKEICQNTTYQKIRAKFAIIFVKN